MRLPIRNLKVDAVQYDGITAVPMLQPGNANRSHERRPTNPLEVSPRLLKLSTNLAGLFIHPQKFNEKSVHNSARIPLKQWLPLRQS